MTGSARRLISLGMSVLIIGALLYGVLAFPTEVRVALPREMPYTWVQIGLRGLAQLFKLHLAGRDRFGSAPAPQQRQDAIALAD